MKKEIIEGINREKAILTEALTRVSHNQGIKLQSRLKELDDFLFKLSQVETQEIK